MIMKRYNKNNRCETQQKFQKITAFFKSDNNNNNIDIFKEADTSVTINLNVAVAEKQVTSNSSDTLKENEIQKEKCSCDVMNVASTSTPSTAISTKHKVEWYQGHKLDLDWLLAKYSFLKKRVEKENTRNRTYVKCEICATHEGEAAKYSKNGVVPMVFGIRVESKQKFERIVDHIESKPHKAAFEASESSRLWELQSDKHPWINTLKKHRVEVVNHLISVCIDVYNDCLLETPSARTWPARSLAVMKAQNYISQLNEAKDWNTDLASFNPPASSLHYRDPAIYSEMQKIVGQLEMKRIAENIRNAICLSLQIDGSVDLQNKDNKFVIAKYLSKDNPNEICNVFVGISQPEQTGAVGLLEAITNTCKTAGVPLDILFGITTDGEAANTGRTGGLWKLLENHVHHGLITVWCWCHRSDLAMESVLNTVPEMKIWLSNLSGLAKYFRTSPSKLKKLQQMYPNIIHFPAYFEIRFAEHIRKLILAVLHNLPGCRIFWEKISNSSERTEKNAATGMLKTWHNCSQQVLITVLMADITAVIQELQKHFQKNSIILPDIITVKENAIRKLEVIRSGPYPGGKEEHFLTTNNTENFDDKDEETGKSKRKTSNKYVTTNRRLWAAVREEIVAAFINFLNVRLNVEDDSTISTMKSLLEASSAQEFITAGRELVKNLFGEENVSNFADSVCDNWSTISELPKLDTRDIGCKYSVQLRNMVAKTTGMVQKLLCAILITSPHSMTTEAVISHYNQIKSKHRASLMEETMNYKLFISLNGIGTAHYDPRPAVAEFLKKKDRRFREPDLEVYAQREFVQKFFRKTGGI